MTARLRTELLLEAIQRDGFICHPAPIFTTDPGPRPLRAGLEPRPDGAWRCNNKAPSRQVQVNPKPSTPPHPYVPAAKYVQNYGIRSNEFSV